MASLIIELLSVKFSKTQSNKQGGYMKQRHFTHSLLAVAIATITSPSLASGLEQSSQSVAPFFEKGNYAEISYAHVDPDIKGVDLMGQPIDDMMDGFSFGSAAVKIAPTDDTAIALLYSEPWAINTQYPSGNFFANNLGVTSANLSSKNLTLLAGGKTKNNFWLYGGVSAEQVKADVSVASYGDNPLYAMGFSSDPVMPVQYSLHADKTDTELAPVVGIAYEKPEIALRASLTYRGETKYRTPVTERFVAPALNIIGQGETIAPTSVSLTMPQSVSLDFQTGLSEKHRLLGMINARWVDWSAFSVTPTLYAQTIGSQTNGEPLAAYNKDGYAIEMALAREFTPKLAGEVRISYDHGTGQPLSALGPYDAVKSVALGAQYKPVPQLAISGGVQYAWIDGGDIVHGGQTVAKIDDGNYIGYGMKLGYYF